MHRLKDHGLTIVLTVATIATLLGMLLTGHSVHNDELAQHHRPLVGLGEYMTSGHFLSALFENWESEFLQMSAYVVLTAFLFQRGSSESKDPDKPAKQDEDPRGHRNDPDAPLPVRMGGLPRTLYSYSLGIALFALFVLSFVLHLKNSAAAEAAEAASHGEPLPTVWEHLSSATFWFESFQNWQSEFLSTAVIVVLSIFLRFRGSPESKAVAEPYLKTGE
jgi:membrane protein implicated in regulation of membrane protease activity